ncbi:hypothetical protein K458DRAFT_319326 [Lentithecium fluviatile CBS 122367]|uniref:Zn(2)-C6 fungal-type domain-containing protein n=1 Tax=Lentithecium fluviatile CBS 122367 TaxID=1168545 RepID=A0A6G1IH89_9PLEO|nr:hypothetical protein K458DRAFT_319326 [Lentithecium fluviatile CBS 122367]
MSMKRTWAQSNEGDNDEHPKSGADAPALAPSISRKVKACAACRKQKIKCIMAEGPPCKRCVERNLSCVLNKSLQTLIEERSEWKHTFASDLGAIHSSLQEVLQRLALPSLPPLQANSGNNLDASERIDIPETEDIGPSCDNSPTLNSQQDAVPHVPIESLYQITRLRSLRSDNVVEEPKTRMSGAAKQIVPDFISNGLISVEDAERLVDLYVNRIDHFMYAIGGAHYRDLESLRRGSPILTACICTVAALHDPMSNHLYGVCKREFQRLMAASMFDRRIDKDHIRAMCIGAYWLHDISWTLSGYAIRRATEINLSSNYQHVLSSGNAEAMGWMRIWYVLYICDHHLSILYGRHSIVREDAIISGWEHLLKTPAFTEADKRLVSQMALLMIMSNVRELFGPDTGEPVPHAFGPQLVNFSRQIDQWMGYWSTELLQHHQFLGKFPTKGVILHYHLAKLHLHSHVFRGLRGAPVSSHFRDSAAAAVSAATSTIEFVLSDIDIRDSLVGIPHYLHSMIAFACVFLLKVASQYGGEYIEDAVVQDLTTKAVHQFRSTAVGKWHLVHLMADGLEKLAAASHNGATDTHASSTNGIGKAELNGTQATGLPFSSLGNNDYENDPLVVGFGDGFNLGTSSFLHFGFDDLDFTSTGFGI